MDISRRPNESRRSYHKRLIYGKLDNKLLGDYDWSELSVPLFGKQLAPDETRKRAYGSYYNFKLEEQDYLEFGIEGGDSSDRIECAFSNHDFEMIEFRKEQQRFFDQRREWKKFLMADARQEHLYNQLSKAAKELPTTLPPLDITPELADCSEDEAVLVLSDWHLGMTTDNVFNTYNVDICKQRIATVVEKALIRIRKNCCKKLHVVVLGDLLHGAIHTSARVASEELVADQLMIASELLAQAVIYLSAEVPETHVYTTYGNHARTVQKKQDNIHRDNMERLIPWWLTQRVAAANAEAEARYGKHLNIIVEPESTNEFVVFDVCGHDICCAHGDLDNIKRAPKTLALLFNKKFGRDIEYILLGDKHHREDFEELGITALLCGALCGSDDYANDKRLYSTPSQLLLIFNEAEGLDAEYRIKC